MLFSLGKQSDLFAQNRVAVGAIIETQSHLWILDTLYRYKDSTLISWRIKDKGYGKPVIIPSNISLTDYTTGEKSTLVSKSDPPLKTKKFQSVSMKMVFPAIGDSATIISIYSSSVFYVDSLHVPSINTLLLSQPQYHVPLYCHHQLYTRRDSVEYSDSIYRSGVTYYYAKKYQKALLCFEKCLAYDRLLDNYKILSSFSKRERNDYDEMWLARCCYKLGYEEIAKKYDQDYKLEPYNREKVEKSDSIYNHLQLYTNEPLTDEEKIREYHKMCTIDSIQFGNKHHRYALSLYVLGQAYSSYRDFMKAKVIFLKAYNIINNIDKDNWLTKSILYEIAKSEHERGDIFSAIHYMELCLEIQNNEIEIHNDYSLLSKYDVLADYYGEIGNWKRALEIERKRVDYYKAKNDKWDYYYALGGYAMYLAEAGYYKQALRIYKKLLNNSSRLSTENEIGNLYFNIRDYETALVYYIKAIDNYKDTSLVFPSIEYSSLARCYAAMKRYDKAILIQKSILAKDSIKTLSYSNIYNGYRSYYRNLSNLAYYFNLNEEFDSALVYEKKSLELKKIYTAPNSDDIAYSHLNIGMSMSGKGRWNEAIRHTLLAYNVFKKEKSRLL